MAYSPESVTTGADLLIDLVETKKQISVSDSAKQLGVPSATIEAWANFLEEEGMLEIQYSFTKPVLVAKSAPKPKKSKRKKDTTFNESQDPGNPLHANEHEPELTAQAKSMDAVPDLLRNGDFNTLKATFLTFQDKMQNMTTAVIPQLSKLHPDKVEDLNTALEDFSESFRTAMALIDHQHFDQAKLQYQATNLKAIELMRISRASHNLISQEEKPTDDASQQNLLDHAYELLKQGNVQGARAEFGELSDQYQHLPEEFERKQKEMQRQLTKLSLDMSTAEEQAAKQHFSVAKKRIEASVKQGKNLIKQRQFKQAFSVYAEMRATFKSLPPGFEKEHESLQKKIVQFYQELSKANQQHSDTQFTTQTKEIEDMLTQLNGLIAEKKTDDGLKLYNKLQQSFATLPDGFLKEKLAMHAKILDAYEKLAQQYHGYTVDKMQHGQGQIVKLIEDVNKAIEAGDTAKAQAEYKKANTLFDQLPAGFLRERTQLKNKLLETYEDLLIHSDESAFNNLKKELGTIDGYIQEIEMNLKTRRYREAEEQYHQAMKHFNGLPGGFLQHKRVVRQKLLDLYRKIVAHHDSAVIGKMKEPEEDAYSKVLLMITDTQHRVAEKDYEALDKNLPVIKQLIADLPNDFDKSNGKLQQQLMVAVDAYQMHQLIKKLKNFEDQKDYAGLDQGTAQLKSAVESFKARTHDYDELVKYAKQQIALYNHLVDERKKLTTKPKNMPQHEGITKPREHHRHHHKEEVHPAHKDIHEKIQQLHHAVKPKVRAP